MPLKHRFVSAKSQSPDSTLISKNEWNENHIFSGGSNGFYLARDSSQDYPTGDGSKWVGLPFVDVTGPGYNVLNNGTDQTSVVNTIISNIGTVGGTLYFPPGTYRGQFTIPYNGISQRYGIRILGAGIGATTFYTTGNNGHCWKIAGNWCELSNALLQAESFTGVSLLKIAPEDEVQTSVVKYQQYNRVHKLALIGNGNPSSNGAGIMLTCGPTVSGTQSGCFYNSFEDIDIQFSNIGLWLKPGPNSGAQNGNSHRNHFKTIRIGQGSCNVGLLLEAGNANIFDGIFCEGVTSGTSPLAVPTAFFTANNDGYGANAVINRDNVIKGGGENCTRMWNNSALYTLVPTWEGNNGIITNYGAAQFGQFNSGYAGGPQDQVIFASTLVYSENTLSLNGAATPYQIHAINAEKDFVLRNVPYNGGGTRRPIAYDLSVNGTSAYPNTDYDLSVGGITANIATFGHQDAHYYMFSGWARFHFRIIFKASVAGTTVSIKLPIFPHEDLYITQAASLTPMEFPLRSKNSSGAGTAWGVMRKVSASEYWLDIPAAQVPGGAHDTAGDTNLLFGTIEYEGQGFI